MALRIINTVLRILLGLVFIASGLLKLFPIEAFEYNFVSIGIANWNTAPFIARLLIGFEFLLGGFLIFNVLMQRFTLKAVLALLLMFTVYLVYQLITEGDDGNCGCFGEYLEMTPSESIIKNVFMAGIAVWLLATKAQLHFNRLPFFLRDRYVASALTIVAMVLPFILNTVTTSPPDANKKEKVGYRLALDNAYSSNNPDKLKVDVRNGKHVLALLSLKCSHCKMAALKMNVMHKRHPELPFYYLLRGNSEIRLKEFMDGTQHADVPYSIYNQNDFFELAQDAVPAIYWLQNDTVVKSETVYTLNEDSILAWVNSNARK